MAKRIRSRGSGTLFKRNGHGPWIASWHDEIGRRRERSTRTTDKASAERILAKHVADAALRRDGVIDARQDKLSAEAKKLLADHFTAYIAHCEHVGQAKRNVIQKERHLARLSASTGADRLCDLSVDALERYLTKLRDQGASARTVNFARQIAVAFASWCVKTGRLANNHLSVAPKLDESRDRRVVRRPLTDDELARLLDVARAHGRAAWYLTAALAGLRKGDLQRLTWADVDFNANAITIRHGKAKREDTVPLHPQLAAVLNHRKAEAMATPTAQVFPQTVTDRTRRRDFERAGIPAVDDQGRTADLHALRTWLGTQLARRGVAPQLAQRIMRHSDYRTTNKHYTVLGLNDTANAIETIPEIGRPTLRPAHATGSTNHPEAPPNDPQLYPQQLGREPAHPGAAPSETNATRTTSLPSRKHLSNTKLRTPTRPCAKKRATGIEPATFSLEG